LPTSTGATLTSVEHTQAKGYQDFMDKEPLIPQSVEHWTLDQLLSRSLEEWKKSLGLPSKIVEAEQHKNHSADTNKMVEDTKEGN
jgi:hypothetical protein